MCEKYLSQLIITTKKAATNAAFLFC